MNILDYIIIAILGFSLLSGMHKGFITSLLATLGFVASWFGAQALYERIANFALSNSTLMAVLNQYLEPENFFTTHTQAVAAVSDVVAGAESSIMNAVNSVSEQFSVFSNAFEANIRTQAFQNLGLTTLADYLDQTIWVAVFNVAAFIVAFVLLYMVMTLLVNLLDRVICFPVLRGVDWLAGGIFGLLRGAVVAVIVLCMIPALTSIISPELTESLMSGSTLYAYVSQFDPLEVTGWLESLVMG